MQEIVESNEPMLSVNVEQSVAEWEAYQELTKKILTDDDYQIQYDNTGKEINRFKKKSAWQKYARAFNVNISIEDKEIVRNKHGRVTECTYRIRAALPTGRFVICEGSCDRAESGKQNAGTNTICGTAETRATNRAISRLVGAGEICGEELDEGFEPNPVNVTPKIIKEAELKPDIKRDDYEDIIDSLCKQLVNEGKKVTKMNALKILPDRGFSERRTKLIKNYIARQWTNE